MASALDSFYYIYPEVLLNIHREFTNKNVSNHLKYSPILIMEIRTRQMLIPYYLVKNLLRLYFLKSKIKTKLFPTSLTHRLGLFFLVFSATI